MKSYLDILYQHKVEAEIELMKIQEKGNNYPAENSELYIEIDKLKRKLVEQKLTTHDFLIKEYLSQHYVGIRSEN